MKPKYPPILPATQRASSPIIAASPSPDTTVKINLRFFEEQSKAQAEREYDENCGPLPDLPEVLADAKQRAIHKKRRKVRSAIVSRRKSSLYEKKLEEELQLRVRANEDLRKQLNEWQTTLHDIHLKIDHIESEIEPNKNPPRQESASTRSEREWHRRETPLPSFSCIQSHTHSLPSPTGLRLPSILEPRETSQITHSTQLTLSMGRSP